MEKINTPEKPYVRSKLLHGIIMVFKKRFPGTKKTKRKKGRRNVPCSRGFNLGVRAHTRTYIYIIPSYVYITIVFASKVRSDNENHPTAVTYIECVRFREPKKKKSPLEDATTALVNDTYEYIMTIFWGCNTI